jgi:hypothetical protein
MDGPKPVAAKGVSSAPRVAAAARRTGNSAAAVARPAAKRLVVKAKAVVLAKAKAAVSVKAKAVLTKAKAKVVKAMVKVVSATQALKMAEAAPSSGDQEQDTADLVYLETRKAEAKKAAASAKLDVSIAKTDLAASRGQFFPADKGAFTVTFNVRQQAQITIGRYSVEVDDESIGIYFSDDNGEEVLLSSTAPLHGKV